MAEALQHLQAAHTRWPEDEALALDLATALLAHGAARALQEGATAQRRAQYAELEASVAALEEAEGRGGETAAEAHVNMGLYLYLLEDHERAVEHFEAAIRAAPKAPELHFLAGTALAISAQRHRERGPDGVPAMASAGAELLQRAIPHLERAAEARDILGAALYNLGACQYMLDQFEPALAAFRKALRLENSEDINSLAGLAAARQAREWQQTVRSQILMGEARKDQLAKRVQELLDAAVHYFRQALLRNELNAVLHANIGLAYMLRNQGRDVEASLRHWQRMRALAGAEMEKRYKEFTQIESLAHASRVQFDDRDIAVREVDVLRWLAVPPLRPAGMRWVMEPVPVQRPWRLVVSTDALRRALRLRDQIAAAEVRLARLRA